MMLKSIYQLLCHEQTMTQTKVPFHSKDDWLLTELDTERSRANGLEMELNRVERELTTLRNENIRLHRIITKLRKNCRSSACVQNDDLPAPTV